MAQYQVGTVVVTNGSQIVTAVDPDSPDTLASQQWSTEVQAGDLFYIADDPVAYVVQSVTNNTRLVLSSAYQGTTVVPAGTPLAGANYAVHRDFSSNYAFPVTSQGDIGIPVLLQLVIGDLDTELKLLDDRITALEP